MQTRSFTHQFYTVPTLLVALLGGFFLLFNSKSEIHLFINGFHAPWADWFFSHITYLGEGVIFTLALAIYVWHSPKLALQLALAGLLTLLSVGVCKNLIFAGAPRPVEYFNQIATLYLVPGQKMNHWNSFPSGHTTAAFAFFGVLAFSMPKEWQAFALFVLAALVGYSRMYLSQHFLQDVVAGTLLGLSIVYAAQWLSVRSFFSKIKWLQKKDEQKP